MIDSGFKLPSGIMSSTTTYLGDFDQCLSIKDHFDGEQFVGKYCLATLNIPRTEQFQHPVLLNSNYLNHSWMADYIEKWYQNDNYFAMTTALCFPSICEADEIRLMLRSCNYFI